MVGINKNMRELPSWTPRVEYKSVSVGMNGERTTDVCKCALAVLPTHQLWMNVALSLPRPRGGHKSGKNRAELILGANSHSEQPFDFLIASCSWSVMNLKKTAATSTTKNSDVLLCF